MAKQYVQTQQEIRNRIRVPASDAKPEEWGEVWGKLGRPEKPDGYKFADKYDGYDMDDTDKSYRDSMRPVLHRIGLNQWQVSEIEKGQVGRVWAESSGGKAVFAMLFKQERGMDLRRQIDTALS